MQLLRTIQKLVDLMENGPNKSCISFSGFYWAFGYKISFFSAFPRKRSDNSTRVANNEVGLRNLNGHYEYYLNMIIRPATIKVSLKVILRSKISAHC